MRPNILLILADDMGYGDFGCFNGGLSHTPTLDQLVAEGTCLTQHYSASPVCAPARASLLTGRSPHRTGVIDTLELRGLDRLALRERTIADLLRQAGYVTGLVGKWHNGALDARYHPTRRGFDEFAGFCGGWAPYVDWHLDRNGSVQASDGRYLTDVLSDEAVDFIRRHRRAPFFLHLAYNAPHYPFHALDEDLAPFRDSGRHTLAVSHIYGMLRSMDRGIARVLQALDDAALAEHTLVLFSNDNGPQFGGAGEMCSTRFNCGFAGAKTLVYEGGIRLPMLLRWPAGLSGRRRIADLVHFTDWLPTLLAAAGATPPPELRLDGVDVLPVLQGERGRVAQQRFWQWDRYAPAGDCNAAMRDGPWKLVRPAIDALMAVSPRDFAMDVDAKYQPQNYPDILREPLPVAADAPAAASQLFDLASDPEERHDRAAEQPDRVLRMEAALGRWFEAVELDRLSIPPA
ncbi:MAG: sulfatase-like hydrolase/transferase [Deltaproteobacteria bacterium]|nr:sulfatase-like hydrolase/transferase [Deltaproteobacteria bacterium]